MYGIRLIRSITSGSSRSGTSDQRSAPRQKSRRAINQVCTAPPRHHGRQPVGASEASLTFAISTPAIQSLPSAFQKPGKNRLNTHGKWPRQGLCLFHGACARNGRAAAEKREVRKKRCISARALRSLKIDAQCETLLPWLECS